MLASLHFIWRRFLTVHALVLPSFCVCVCILHAPNTTTSTMQITLILRSPDFAHRTWFFDCQATYHALSIRGIYLHKLLYIYVIQEHRSCKRGFLDPLHGVWIINLAFCFVEQHLLAAGKEEHRLFNSCWRTSPNVLDSPRSTCYGFLELIDVFSFQILRKKTINMFLSEAAS